MELRTLRYFLALAQEGTVSNAAKALHVTQPTLSRQLADLERGFGKQLFERGAKRIVLTDEGSAPYASTAEAIVELADQGRGRAGPARARRGRRCVRRMRRVGRHAHHPACGETYARRASRRAFPSVQRHERRFDGPLQRGVVRLHGGIRGREPSRLPVVPASDARHLGRAHARGFPLGGSSRRARRRPGRASRHAARARRSRRASCRRGRARRSIPGTWWPRTTSCSTGRSWWRRASGRPSATTGW